MKKEVHIKINHCNDCCYCNARIAGYLCNLEFDKTIDNNPDYHKVKIPDWCPLDDYKDPGVKVGVTAIIVKDGKVLLGERGDKVETLKNFYCFPGGRMDYGEDGPKKSLAREIKEETGIEINPDSFSFVRESDEFFPGEEKHYVNLVYIVHEFKGEPKNLEGEEKCKGWKWFSPDNLPENIFEKAKESIEIAKELIDKIQTNKK